MKVDDTSLGSSSFQLVIDAAVREEVDWAITQVIQITLFWSSFEPSVLLKAPYPEFDKDSVSDKTLSLKVDEETEQQYFSPILLDCSSESWQKSLPKIVDETPSKKV